MGSIIRQASIELIVVFRVVVYVYVRSLIRQLLFRIQIMAATAYNTCYWLLLLLLLQLIVVVVVLYKASMID